VGAAAGGMFFSRSSVTYLVWFHDNIEDIYIIYMRFEMGYIEMEYDVGFVWKRRGELQHALVQCRLSSFKAH
jgi:hypothetical protein